MLRLLDHLGDHGLHHADIAVQRASNQPGQQRDPEALGEPEDEARDGDTAQAGEDNGLAAIAIGQCSPEDSRHCFGDSVGGHQQSAVKGSVCLVSIMKVHDERVGVGKDGVERDWLREATYCCKQGD